MQKFRMKNKKRGKKLKVEGEENVKSKVLKNLLPVLQHLILCQVNAASSYYSSRKFIILFPGITFYCSVQYCTVYIAL